MKNETKNHWEEVYGTKRPNEVSWTQEIPQTSLDFIHSFNLSKSAKIIDVGGGDSRLVDFLLDEGFKNLTVLDISALALERARKRLGKRAKDVNWVVADVNDFHPETAFDLWHDRATFHFLTTTDEITAYLNIVRTTVVGFITIGTFSDAGPTKCSGLNVKQYSESELHEHLNIGFEKIRCITEDHKTPFGTTQNFLFCSFKRGTGARHSD